jgi:creatinine amidohydrolase
MSTASGSLSSAAPASAEKGRVLTEWLVERLVAILDDEFPAVAGNSAASIDQSPD